MGHRLEKVLIKGLVFHLAFALCCSQVAAGLFQKICTKNGGNFKKLGNERMCTCSENKQINPFDEGCTAALSTAQKELNERLLNKVKSMTSDLDYMKALKLVLEGANLLYQDGEGHSALTLSKQGSSFIHKALYRNLSDILELTPGGPCLTRQNQFEPLVELTQGMVPVLEKAGAVIPIEYAEVQETIVGARNFLDSCTAGKKIPLKFEVTNNTPTREIIGKALESYSDLIIGENHPHLNSKKALIDNMDILKKQGAVIALEHVPRIPFQEIWNKYFHSHDTPMPKELENELIKQDRDHWISNGELGFLGLVKAAKKAQVDLIFFETRGSYLASWEPKQNYDDVGIERIAAMNYVEKITVDRERKGRKVVHFVGNAHAHTIAGVPGLSELNNGAPTLVITDHKGPRSIKLNTHILGKAFTDIEVLEPEIPLKK